MKFLCDVHISYKIVDFFVSSGFEALHVNKLTDKWYTKDADICAYADLHDYIVVTKDSDFRDSFYIKSTPKKLLKINLGNISNSQLVEILSKNIIVLNRFITKKIIMLEVETDGVIHEYGPQPN